MNYKKNNKHYRNLEFKYKTSLNKERKTIEVLKKDFKLQLLWLTM